MTNELPPKLVCKLYLPTAFNHTAQNRLHKLVQSPNKIQFQPSSGNNICHQLKQSPKRKTNFKTMFSERSDRYKEQREIKWSISRMLQKAKPEANTISFISKLYKKSGGKEVTIRRHKERSEESVFLAKDVLEFKPKLLNEKVDPRLTKTAEKDRKRRIKSINHRTLHSTRQGPRASPDP